MGPPGKSGVDGLTVSLNFTVIIAAMIEGLLQLKISHALGFISSRQESRIGYCLRSNLNTITTGYGLA